ncbi:MAG: hypothetical protein L6416_04920 [Candidatus Omnitrophica bacterium]|nr:hypothetical protein [Candidatus Omnitrophota bacterium]
MKKIVIFLVFIFAFNCRLYAQEDLDENKDLKKTEGELGRLNSQLGQMKTSYDKRIDALEAKIKQVQSAGCFQSFNPDISVIGDFIFHATDKKDDEQYNQFKMRQAELAFSATVDPYSRADFFMHVEQEDGGWKIGLCEGYLTLLELPLDLQAKIGKFKAGFGKVNRIHLHALPWCDYPNMLTNFFGEEGMSEPGISVSSLLANPWDQYIELTFEALNNHNAASFAGNEGRDMAYVAHLKNFFEINPESTLELGGSFATGPNDSGHGSNRTNLEGIDLTYKWRPLKEGLYKSLVFQNEALFSQKDQVDLNQVDSRGAYSSLIYQFARRLSVFSRYDLSEFPDYSNRRDEAVSAGMTFAQSEYCFWRLHFKHTDRDYDKNSNEMWLQCNFGLGPHRAHTY